MKHILGISAFYHDSAAAIISDGKIVAAAQEERFTRVKHDAEFPKNAVEFCLRQAGITEEQLDSVVFYEKPLLKLERLLETYLAYAPKGLRQFMKAVPVWCNQKLFIPREIDKGLGGGYNGPIHFCQHHEAHAASAFFPSPFEEAAVLTVDGVGEWATTTWGIGRGNKLELKQEIRFPHSLGLLYSAFTYYTGFKVNSGEYKVMGLAPYGEPKYAKLITDHLIDVKEDGSFWMDQSYFDYAAGLVMTNDKFADLFGGPARVSESNLGQREMDLAASVQKVTEDIMITMTRHIHKLTGMANLCLAGGVALNCVANGKVLKDGRFKNIWIQPASGDAGGALGAALVGLHHVAQQPRKACHPDSQSGSYLGSDLPHAEVSAALDKLGATYEHHPDEDALCARVAGLLAEGNIVGHVYGRMEYGPRALGHRSILGDPRNKEMQAQMNLKVKFRESFRPFAPSVLRHRVADYFDLDSDSPYMLIVAPVDDKIRKPMTAAEDALFGIEKLNCIRSELPAITHVDYSARVQTVTPEQSPRYHRLISAFEKQTGCGVLVNTSFNIRGEPIVHDTNDAYRCFMFTDMEALVVGNCVCLKSKQPPMEGAEEYKAQFKLD
ncbi:MAG: carbamoyltransferase [Prosthecobacter sp.]